MGEICICRTCRENSLLNRFFQEFSLEKQFKCLRYILLYQNTIILFPRTFPFKKKNMIVPALYSIWKEKLRVFSSEIPTCED